MKYITTKILLASVLLLTTLSCEVEEFNNNKKAFFEVTPNSLFNTAQKQMVDQTIIQDVNNNNYRLFMEQWTATTYTDEANYDIITRGISQEIYKEFYRDVLKGLQRASEIIDKELETVLEVQKPVLNNQKAVIDIHTVFTYSQLVETFGDVPYSEALDDNNLTPKYDDARTIYNDLLSKLKTAIESIDTDNSSFDVDNIYAGDISKWKKFGASLYLRMGMVLADVDAVAAKTIVEAAVRYGVFESNDDNAMYKYLSVSPNRNPVYETITASGRTDYVIASTFVEKLDDLADPRRSIFYTSLADGTYKGGVPGSSNSYSNFSHTNSGKVAGKPGSVFQYSEVELLLAEAAQRGYSVGGTAKEHYEKGVKASMDFWSVDSKDSKAYIASAKVSYDATKYKQLIGDQVWIATYNSGYPSWLSWRRLDYPKLKGATSPKTSNGQPPYRMRYSTAEQTLNRSSYEAASTAIGGDKLETKLFFDKN